MSIRKITKLLDMFEKLAQLDSQLSSPNVIVEPVQPVINKAIELLKKFKPDIFVGVRKIVVAPSSYYGHVQSGQDKDPAVVNINLSRLISESGGDHNSQQAITSVAITIAHEIGHVKSYNKEQGFVGNEMPAENLEREFQNWVERNNNL